ncbi:uncharacterized protein LOC131455840 [Solea solea]|uniref:uncharacterized protein LOC131455840 n=1 Tax=Solea solea TaxID=90069 RepID=UPI00272D74E6|nr:uncharacterized protein LOC131455840 [Solea solea]
MTAHVVVFVLLLVAAAAEPGLATLDTGVNETTWTQEPGDQSVQRPLLSPKTGMTACKHLLKVEQGIESVLLPYVPQVNMSSASFVVWARKGGSGSTFVHTLDKSGDRPKDPRYAGRTQMRPDALQSGNLSLTLMRPAANDSGNYTCTVREFGQELSHCEVQLAVVVRGTEDPPNLTWIAAVVVPVLVLVFVGVGAIIGYKKFCKRKTDVPKDNSEGQQLRDLQVEVESGVESVQLPFGATPELPAGFTVEWKTGEKMVHATEPGVQDQKYRGRTEMNDETFELTLKHPAEIDEGTYSCTVYDKKRIVETRQVELKVKDAVVEVESGAESVWLPFQTTPNLPDDAMVHWWHDNLEACLHFYPDSSKQKLGYRDRTEMNVEPLRTGDLSLTLNRPIAGEAGTFICEVFDTQPRLLREKRIRLTITDTRLMINPLPPGEEGTPLMSDQTEEPHD